MKLHGRARSLVAFVVLCGLVVGSRSFEPSAAGPVEERRTESSHEVVGMRTETTRTFTTDQPGVYRTEVFAQPKFFRENDEWAEISTAVDRVPGDRKGYRSRATSIGVELGEWSDGALARVRTKSGKQVGFGLEGARKVDGRAANDKVAYADVFANVDLELQVLPSGLKETIILESAASPRTFRFPLSLEGVRAKLDESGGVLLVDEAGKPHAKIPPGFMDEALGKSRAGGIPARSYGVKYALEEGPSGQVLVVSLDEAWLSDPARGYPVRVDPTVTTVTGDADDTYVNQLGAGNRSAELELATGNAFGSNRSFVHFNNLFFLRGKIINNATLKLWQANSNSCTASFTEVYRVTGAWQGATLTTWPGATFADKIGEFNDAKGFSAACPAGQSQVAITGAVQNWVRNTWPNHGLMLKARNEGVVAEAKIFSSAQAPAPPHLEVTWSDGVVDEFVHDEMGRVRGAIDKDFDTARYNYDSIGNITKVERYPSTKVSILQLTPTQGRAGNSVVIAGTGFSTVLAENAVTFNGVAATVTAATTTSLTVTVPVGVTTGKVRVARATQFEDSQHNFRVLAAAPTVGSLGTKVVQQNSATTITVPGTGFDTDPMRNSVWIDATAAAVGATPAPTATSLTVSLPPGMPSGRVSVTTASGTSNQSGDVFVVPTGTDPATIDPKRIAVGQSASAASGKTALVIFDVVKGRQYRIRIANQCPGSLGETVRVFQPSGTVILSGGVNCGDGTVRNFVAPLSGTLTAHATAGYFKVWECADLATCPEPASAAAGDGGAAMPAALERPDADLHSGSVSGVVQTAVGDEPVAGATVSINGRRAVTDPSGSFLVRGIEPGRNEIRVDANRSASGKRHGYWTFGVDVEAGKTTALPKPVWVPTIDGTEPAVDVADKLEGDVKLTHQQLPGLEVTIRAGSTIKDREYRVVNNIALIPLDPAKPPFAMPSTSTYFSVQGVGDNPTGGLYVENGEAEVVYPNSDNLPPGTETTFFRYEMATGWVPYGTGTVTPDGKSVRPAPGARVWDFLGSANFGPFFGKRDSRSGNDKEDKEEDGDPIDLRTGGFTFSRTDLFVDDLLSPLVVDRIYDSKMQHADPSSQKAIGPFGRETQLGLDLQIGGNCNGGQSIVLDLPGGGRIPFENVANGGLCWAGQVNVARVTAGEWFGARMEFTGRGSATVTRIDGHQYFFDDFGLLYRIVDRNGNALEMTRFGGGAQSGWPHGWASPISFVRSPNGRWIRFTYNADCGAVFNPEAGQVDRQTRACMITKAEDNAGRTVSYQYDTQDRLTVVTDPAGQTLTYEYGDAARPNAITKVINHDANVLVENHYNADGRVDWQFLSGDNLANRPKYQFNYVFSGSTHTHTDVTDPTGAVSRTEYNTEGRPWKTTSFVGTAFQQTLERTLQANTGRLDQVKVTDAVYPAGRTTSYLYNPDGVAWDPLNAASKPDDMTLRQETSEGTAGGDSYVKMFGYTPWVFGQPTTITEPGTGRLWKRDFDAKGNLTKVTDPLNRVTGFEYTAEGQPWRATSSAGATLLAATMEYTRGDLTKVTDQTNRAITYIRDGLGRPFTQVDAAGERSMWIYNKLNQVTRAVHADGTGTNFGYGLYGITSVTDHAGNLTKTDFNKFPSAWRRTDPFGKVEQSTFRADGRADTATDRRGIVTAFDYQAGTGRLEFTRYGRTGTAPNYTYESTVKTEWDQANRVRQIVDSMGGTTTYTYDDFDRVKTEVGPRGTLTYTYEAGTGRLKTATVTGQPTTTYNYNNADQVQSIVKGTQTTTFVYDVHGRIDRVDLPNGSKQDYTLDGAGRTLRIDYLHPTNTALNRAITYTHDKAGWTQAVGGNLNPHVLPNQVDGTTYDKYRLTSWNGGGTIAYDFEGNVTSDGWTNYTWNARNELVSTGGLTTPSSYQYDGLGQRHSVTHGGATSRFLHDRGTVVQEQDGAGTPTANLTLSGLDGYINRQAGAANETFFTDANNNTVALADGTGGVTNTYSYKPFGEPSTVGSSTNRFRFTGRDQDGTTLQYFRSRYYNPNWGRFMSEDAIGLNAGVNVYTFPGNNPIDQTDPTGHVAPLVAACGVGAATNVVAHWLTGGKMDFNNIAREAATGCVIDVVTGGIGSKLSKARYADDGLRGANRADDAARGGRRADDAARRGSKADDVGRADNAGRGGGRADDGGSTSQGSRSSDACRTGMSFSAETPVLMADGSRKRIADVRVGELVLATDPMTGERGAREVLATWPHVDSLFTLATSAGPIVTTEDHKFWSETSSEWVQARQLQRGDRLKTVDGRIATVERFELLSVRAEDAFDLTVGGLHTYFVAAGDTSVLVHNCTGPARPRVKPKKPSTPPSWVLNEGHYAEATDANPVAAAQRIMNEHYGAGGWSSRGAGSEYSQLQKWLSRHFSWS